MREVIAELGEESEEFREAWALHEVRHPPALRHGLILERLGEVRFRITDLTPSSQSSSKIIVFQPVDDESRKGLHASVEAGDGGRVAG